MQGKTYPPVKEPTRIAKDLFKNKVRIEKIVSGAHHSLALTN